MEFESSHLISINNSKQGDNGFIFSYEKDLKLLSNLLRIIFGAINLCIIIFAIIIFSFKRMNIIISLDFSFFGNKLNILKQYQEEQNHFCDNIRYSFNKRLEEKIILYNINLNDTKFEMFLFNNYDYLSWKIQLNQSLESEATLHMLNAIKYFQDKYDFENDEIAVVDIGANVGWYTTFFGSLKYTIFSFEPLPENNYLLRKNFCRNNKDFFGPASTITIINKALYPIEAVCDYYKDLKNEKKNLILCDKTKEKNLDKNYVKINRIKSSQLSNFIPLMNHKRITLIIIDLESEGEKAIESGRELIDKYHIPYIFIEFNMLMFALHETRPQDFLKFFVDTGYKISLNGFLSNEYISIEDLMKTNFITINLYLVFVGK